MEVSVWVPIIVALIAASSGYFAARAARTSMAIEKENKQIELAVSGLASLVDELQEERRECKQDLVEVRSRLALVELQLDERKRRDNAPR